MWKRWNLRVKIILIAFWVTCVPFFLAMTVLYRHMSASYAAQVSTYNHYAMRVLAQSIDQIIDMADNVTLFTLINPQIKKYLQTSRGATTPERYNQYESEAVQALNFLPHTAQAVRYTVVQALDGRAISNGPGYYIASPREVEAVAALEGKALWSIERYTDTIASITACRLIRDAQRLSHHLGVVKVYVDLRTVQQQLAPPADFPLTENYIVGADGTVIIRPAGGGNPDIVAIDPSLLHGAAQNTTTVTLGGQRYFLSAYPLEANDWIALSLLPNAYFSDHLQKLLHILLLCFLLFCAAALLLSAVFSRIIVRPIREISSLMISVAGEDFSVRTSVQGSNEIAVLQQCFNAMSERLEKLYGEVYGYNLRLKEAQIKELQSKINPHFLYNTLDSLYWMSQLRGMKDMGEMITALSNLFKISLKVDAHGFIPLSTEWQHVNHYIVIQRLRFADSIRFELAYDASLDRVPTLALILQPLVENAILHGLEPNGGGVVGVRVYQRDACVVFDVWDDGVGAPPGAIEAMLRGGAESGGTKGFALHNIHSRLLMKYGPPFGLAHISRPEGGSLFRVTQPLREADDDQNADRG